MSMPAYETPVAPAAQGPQARVRGGIAKGRT